MSSNEYWKKREEENRAKVIRDEAEFNSRLASLYASLESNITKEINGFYQKYARAEGITMAEAKKAVDQMDVEAFKAKAAKYVKNKDFSKQANDELRLYNATMKINRMEMLKANIGLELIDMFGEFETDLDSTLLRRAISEFERQAGILGASVEKSAQNARQVVNASFNNAHFSDRIWMYQGQLKNELASLITNGIVQGTHSRELARHIRLLSKSFEKSKLNAERLVRTEMARVQTAVQEKSFIDNGFDEYMYMALGARACPICRAIDGKVFQVKLMQVGENAPPMHPNCRCSTAAYMSRGISLSIESRNKPIGNPAGIEIFDEDLNERQKQLLNKLPKYNDYVIVNKRDASMKDLAALTAYTGVEFAMFTKKGKRLIQRGDAFSVDILPEKAKQLANEGYKWSGHTHPGRSFNYLSPSSGDRDVLEAFGMKRSAIYNSAGMIYIFGTSKGEDIGGV